MLAPSERNSPPVAHPAKMAGTPRANSARISAGTVKRNPSDRSAPGARGAVSGTKPVSAASPRYTTTSGAKTSAIASRDPSSARPAASAPMPSPSIGATAFHTAADPGRRGDSRSVIAADTAERSSPLATPCSTRARISSGTDSACQNTSTLAASSTSPELATGRRPT